MAYHLFRSIVRKFHKSLVTRGFFGTCWFLCAGTVRLIRKWIRLQSPAARSQRARELAFDQQFGLDTCGRIPLSSLDVDAGNWMHGHGYQAIGPVEFYEELKPFEIRYQDFTFIDFGSGKGRALLLASRLPFQRVVGVEFSKTLHDIAESNVEKFAAQNQCRAEIELHCMDATEFPLPEGPLVLYMNNPFDEQVMDRLIDHVSASMQHHPRRMVVCYYTPMHGELWAESDLFDELRFDDVLGLYDNKRVLDSLLGRTARIAS